MPRPYYVLAPHQLVDFTTTAHSVLAGTGGAAYALPAPLITELAAQRDALSDDLAGVDSAKVALHTAVGKKQTSDAALRNLLGVVAKKCYANDAVTDTMLEALGFAPRSTTRTRKMPLAPTNLAITPNIDGTVDLKWSKNGNTSGTQYLVEQQIDGEFTIVKSVLSTRTKLSGYSAGEPVSFRIRATRNDVISASSNVITIYNNLIVPAPVLHVA